MTAEHAGWRIVALSLVAFFGVWACNESTGPGEARAGHIEVTVTTTGSDLDPDGYGLSIDGVSGPAIDVDATTTLSGLPAGDHVLELLGVSVNCRVEGDNPRTVVVVGDETVTVSFALVCEPAVGSIRVSTSTLGPTPDPDGYDLSVDATFIRTLGGDEVATLDALVPGSHSVELGGVAPNCEVGGGNLREVTVYAEATSVVEFDVRCVLVGREIAFVSDRRLGPGGGEVFLVDADGGNPTSLTTDEAWDVQPAWGPGGEAIAFAREGGWFDFDVYVLGGDDVVPRRLTSTGSADQPTWSPDGTALAYMDDSSWDAELYVIGADGQGRVQLTNEAGFDGQPAWSPDGTRIAFTSERDGNAEIYLVDADGSDPVRVTADPAADRDPAWSPDGTRIAFTSERDGNAEIYLVDADGSNPTNLTRNPAQDYDPAWAW